MSRALSADTGAWGGENMDDKQVMRAQETYRINQIQTASREQLLLIT